MSQYLTVTDWAALVRGLGGFGAAQDRTDERITDDGPLLEEEVLVLRPGVNAQTPHVQNEGAAGSAVSTWQLQEKHLS